jgi:hypothetical protein
MNSGAQGWPGEGAELAHAEYALCITVQQRAQHMMPNRVALTPWPRSFGVACDFGSLGVTCATDARV